MYAHLYPHIHTDMFVLEENIQVRHKNFDLHVFIVGTLAFGKKKFLHWLCEVAVRVLKLYFQCLGK